MKKSLAVLSMAGCVLVWAATPLFCADKILPVHSVPGPKQAEAVQPGQLEFHGKGEIFRVGKDEVGEPIIVIDDRLKYFAKNALFYDKDKNPLKFSNFHRGNRVGYMLNEKSRITRLYLLKN